MKQRTARSVVEVLEWIETTPHHWASAEEPGFFVIGNRECKLRIPVSLYRSMDGLIDVGGEFDSRMYRASELGRKMLAV